jgi:hypothetical protein
MDGSIPLTAETFRDLLTGHRRRVAALADLFGRILGGSLSLWAEADRAPSKLPQYRGRLRLWHSSP